MKAQGKVISLCGKVAYVLCERSSSCVACSGCESRGACHAELIFGEQNRSVEAPCRNLLDAKVGDIVEIESSTEKTLFASVLVFIAPLVISFVCYLVSVILNASVFVSAVTAILSFVMAFLLISKMLNKSYRNSYIANIVKIIEESEL